MFQSVDFPLFIRCLVEKLWSLGVTVPGNPITHAGVSLILRRIQAIPRQLEAIAARLAAGTLRPPTPRASPRPSSNPRRVAPVGWPNRLPGSHAWLVRLSLPFAPFGGQLERMLRDPEVQALVAAAPQARRLLRPLCRMLGVTVLKELPPAPKPPAPVRRAWPAPSDSPLPSALALQPAISKFA